MTRRQLADRSLNGVVFVWLALFVGMAIWSERTGLQPSRVWLAPFGCLATLVGAHLIVFRSENAERAQQQGARYGLGRAAPGARMLVLHGVLWLAFGAVALSVGLAELNR